jgi:hypothetical protein
LIDGDIAEGGGDFTVVSALVVELTVELDVESVTIGSLAYANDAQKTILIVMSNFLNIFLPYYFDVEHSEEKVKLQLYL